MIVQTVAEKSEKRLLSVLALRRQSSRARQESEDSSTLMWLAYITYGQRPAHLLADSSPPRSRLAEKYERLFGRNSQDTGKNNLQEAGPW